MRPPRQNNFFALLETGPDESPLSTYFNFVDLFEYFNRIMSMNLYFICLQFCLLMSVFHGLFVLITSFISTCTLLHHFFMAIIFGNECDNQFGLINFVSITNYRYLRAGKKGKNLDYIYEESEMNEEERRQQLFGKKKKKKKPKKKQTSRPPTPPTRSTSLIETAGLATMAVRWKRKMEKSKLNVVEEQSAIELESFPPPPSFLLSNSPLPPLPPKRSSSLKVASKVATVAVRWKMKAQKNSAGSEKQSVEFPPPPPELLFPTPPPLFHMSDTSIILNDSLPPPPDFLLAMTPPPMLNILPPPPSVLLVDTPVPSPVPLAEIHVTYQSFQDEHCLPGCPVDCKDKMNAITPRP